MSRERERVVLTQDDLMFAKLGGRKMRGHLETEALQRTLKAVGKTLVDCGVGADQAVAITSQMVDAVVNARRTELCEAFIGEMGAVSGESNLFAKLEYGGGTKIGVALIFGEGVLMDTVSAAFDKDVAEGDADDDGDEEDEEFEDGEE